MSPTGKTGPRVRFGTDGIRGVANIELTAEVALMVGRCAAHYMCNTKKGTTGRVLVGKDTRVSGDMIEAALVAGISSAGCEAWRVGITPTPGLAYLTKSLNGDCGIMISASHNPAEDNGIKMFSGDGFKLEDEDERAIEQLIERGPRAIKVPSGDNVGASFDKGNMAANYITHVKRLLRGVFVEGRIVVDCANGAASRYAKRIFKDAAEEVIFINADEDGRKINVDCGSTRPDKLARKVLKHNAMLGFAFDGDADRVIFIDEKGGIVDGDQIMLLCAGRMMEENRLPRKTVVSTVMSNMGFERALKKIGGKMIRTAVGDKFVMREMAAGGLNLGGEQSGHVIFLDLTTTGDGLLTAAQTLKYAASAKVPFSQQTKMKRSAQFLKNIRVPDKDAFYQNAKIQKKVAEIEKRLGTDGRVVVRPSGTEPLIRVMVETWDREQAEACTDEILETVRKELKVE
jgi:phosphoglucosamine mutase